MQVLVSRQDSLDPQVKDQWQHSALVRQSVAHIPSDQTYSAIVLINKSVIQHSDPSVESVIMC